MHSKSSFHSFAFVLTTASLGLACSLSDVSPISNDKQALCDLRPGKPQCTDVRNAASTSLVVFQNLCSTLKASAKDASGYKADATCPTADMWGGCQSNSGGSQQTNWFYKSDKYKTADDAKKDCTDGTWVAPQ